MESRENNFEEVEVLDEQKAKYIIEKQRKLDEIVTQKIKDKQDEMDFETKIGNRIVNITLATGLASSLFYMYQVKTGDISNFEVVISSLGLIASGGVSGIGASVLLNAKLKELQINKLYKENPHLAPQGYKETEIEEESPKTKIRNLQVFSDRIKKAGNIIKYGGYTVGLIALLGADEAAKNGDITPLEMFTLNATSFAGNSAFLLGDSIKNIPEEVEDIENIYDEYPQIRPKVKKPKRL